MQHKKDLWSLALHEPYIDPADLTTAIERQIADNDLDYRSRLLIRDSMDALEQKWGKERLSSWLSHSPAQLRILSIRHEEFERPGFPSLRRRIVETTKPESVRKYFEELGRVTRRTTKIYVGGSIALILRGYLARRTEDIDLVDEVPQDLRTQYRLLEELERNYNLQLAHFQSHYLPMRWEQRVQSFDIFGSLQVYLIDPGDVFLSKLFSRREKDLDDLHILKAKIDKDVLARRMNADMQSSLANDNMRERAEQNWYILYGEKLPHEHQPPSQPAPSA